jgi:hypothetical protein
MQLAHSLWLNRRSSRPIEINQWECTLTHDLGHHQNQPNERPRAIIYAPVVEPGAAVRCLDHCRESGYHLIGVVVADFSAALRMLGDAKAVILVVAERSDLPPGRTPRIEVASSAAPSWRRASRMRTTRLNRRDAAG